MVRPTSSDGCRLLQPSELAPVCESGASPPFDCANFCAHPTDRLAHVRNGQPHARGSVKLFFFSSNVENERVVLPGPPALGAGGLRFKSGRPDQKYLACILLLIESAVHLTPHLWNSGRQEVWSRKSFSLREFATWRICKNMRRQECYTESIERREVKPALFGKYGENLGDPTHFSSHWIIGTANQ